MAKTESEDFSVKEAAGNFCWNIGGEQISSLRKSCARDKKKNETFLSSLRLQKEPGAIAPEVDKETTGIKKKKRVVCGFTLAVLYLASGSYP